MHNSISGSKKIKLRDGAFHLDSDFLFSETSIKDIEKSVLSSRRNPPPYVRSALTYQGGKFRLIKYLDAVFPRDKKVLIDVFTGSMTVVANLMKSGAGNKFEIAVCNDLNAPLMLFYNCLYTPRECRIAEEVRNRAAAICQSLVDELVNISGTDVIRNKIRENNDLYSRLKILYQGMIITPINRLLRQYFNDHGFSPSDQVNYMALFLLMTKMSMNGGFEVRRGEIISSCNGIIPSENVLNCAEIFLLWLHPLITSGLVELRSLDYIELVNSVTEDLHEDVDGCFFYFDPPYYNTNVAYTSSWNIDVENNFCNLLRNLLERKLAFALSNTIVHNGLLNRILLKFLLENRSLRVLVPSINYNVSKNNNETIEVLVIPKYANNERLSSLNNRARNFAGRNKFEEMRELNSTDLRDLIRYPDFNR